MRSLENIAVVMSLLFSYVALAVGHGHRQQNHHDHEHHHDQYVEVKQMFYPEQVMHYVPGSAPTSAPHFPSRD